jgi:hypothetical protein
VIHSSTVDSLPWACPKFVPKSRGFNPESSQVEDEEVVELLARNQKVESATAA